MPKTDLNDEKEQAEGEDQRQEAAEEKIKEVEEQVAKKEATKLDAPINRPRK